MAREPLPRPDGRHRAARTDRVRRSGGRRTRILVSGGVVLGLVAAGTAAGAAFKAGSGPGTSTFTPTDDAYVSLARPDFNSGTAGKLVASDAPADRKITYLRFAVPEGTVVGSARLVLRRTDHHLPPAVVFSATSAEGWSEKTLTARTAPKVGATVASVQTSWSGREVSLDVSKLVNGPGNYAFAVTSPATDSVSAFMSKESGDQGPVLQTTPGAGGMPTDPTGAPTKPVPPIPTLSPTTKPAPTSTPPAPTATTTTTPPAPPTGGCTVSKLLVPSCGAWFGIAPNALTFTKPRAEELSIYEGKVGQPADIMHVYKTNNALFPSKEDIAMARDPKHRRILFINWKPSTSLTWAQVAAGNSGVDAQIDKLSAYIKTTFPERFFLSIYHEPENDVNPAAGSGMTAKDYRAMYRHVALRLKANGTDNAILTMVYMGFPKWGGQSWFADLYPGSDVVDWMGYDPYASAAPGYSGGTFSDMVNRKDKSISGWPGFYSWSQTVAPGKPMVLAEWGVSEYASDPAAKARFLRGVVAEAKKWPLLKALVYFETPKAHIGDTSVSSSASSLAGYKDMVADPYFNQTVPTS